jgi:uncharacterized protein (DUF2249 family)
MPIEVELAGANAKRKAGGCGCGCSTDDVATLVAHDLPKVIRHGAIIGGLTSLKAGGKLQIVFSHDPLPLLSQLERVAPGELGLEYLARGPVDWRIEFTRR